MYLVLEALQGLLLGQLEAQAGCLLLLEALTLRSWLHDTHGYPCFLHLTTLYA
jgi:hypothetical protein